MPVLARPVRIFWNSFLRTARVFSMLDFMSLSTVLDIRLFSLYDGADFLAVDDLVDVSRGGQVKDDDRQFVVHAERYGGCVHDLQSSFEDIDVGKLGEFDGVGVFLRVGRVNAVDLGALEDYLGADLHGAQAGGRVGREVGIAGACAENHDAPFFQVADGAAADVGFCNLLHGDGRL